MRLVLAFVALATSLQLLASLPAAAQEVRRISRACGIYLALDDEPGLDGFPVVIDSIRGGKVVLATPSLEGKGEGKKILGRAMPTLSQAREHGERQQLARRLVLEVDGVASVMLRHDHGYSDDELFEKRARDFAKECRSKLVVGGRPEGAMVIIDGRRQGTLPIEIETGAGSREVVIESRGYRSSKQKLVLEPGATRQITAELVPLARYELVADPDDPTAEGAVVVLDGHFVGQVPTTVHADEGSHTLRLYHPERQPLERVLEATLGEQQTLALALEPAVDVCPSWDVTGNLKQGSSALDRLLRGSTLEAMIPLHLVVSSTMESRLPVTHIVDGRRILFEARRGDNYEAHPADLLGRELGGLAFGEVGVEVLTPPRGTVTVTEVEAKKSTLVVKLRHDDGTENAVYADFTRPAKEVSITEAIAALCWVLR